MSRQWNKITLGVALIAHCVHAGPRYDDSIPDPETPQLRYSLKVFAMGRPTGPDSCLEVDLKPRLPESLFQNQTGDYRRARAGLTLVASYLREPRLSFGSVAHVVVPTASIEATVDALFEQGVCLEEEISTASVMKQAGRNPLLGRRIASDSTDLVRTRALDCNDSASDTVSNMSDPLPLTPQWDTLLEPSRLIQTTEYRRVQDALECKLQRIRVEPKPEFKQERASGDRLANRIRGLLDQERAIVLDSERTIVARQWRDNQCWFEIAGTEGTEWIQEPSLISEPKTLSWIQ